LEGRLDFSGKGTVKTGSPKKASSTGSSCDSEANISDSESLPKKKRVVADISQKRNKAKQHKADISGSNLSAESDDKVSNYKKKETSHTASKKMETKSVSSWRDCPSAVASNVNRAGEYKRKNDDKQLRATKQKKNI
jgi:hypothetical protein